MYKALLIKNRMGASFKGFFFAITAFHLMIAAHFWCVNQPDKSMKKIKLEQDSNQATWSEVAAACSRAAANLNRLKK